jgi:hypothetical protein
MPGASAVLDWLRQMAAGRQGGLSPAGPGGNPYAAASIGPGAGGAFVPPQAPVVPGIEGLAATMPTTPTGAAMPPLQMGAPYPMPEQAGLPFPGPQTKTDPRAPLQFAWGGGTPEDYVPGVSKVLEMTGAPTGREGFMGAAPVAGGQAPGGFGPSQQNWEDVANPMGFEAFREAPMVREAIESAQDPLWRERQVSGIEQAAQEAIIGAGAEAQKGVLREQADIEMEMAQQARQDMTMAYDQAVEEMEAAQPGVPLTEAQRQMLWSQIQMRFTGVDPLTGK